MNKSQRSRREFIKTSAKAGAGLSLALTSASSYARILGANDRIILSVAGLNNRGMALIQSAINAAGDSVHIHSICDVDSRVIAEKSAAIAKVTGRARAGIEKRAEAVTAGRR